jgi:hypothetical protein
MVWEEYRALALFSPCRSSSASGVENRSPGPSFSSNTRCKEEPEAEGLTDAAADPTAASRLGLRPAEAEANRRSRRSCPGDEDEDEDGPVLLLLLPLISPPPLPLWLLP